PLPAAFTRSSPSPAKPERNWLRVLPSSWSVIEGRKLRKAQAPPPTSRASSRTAAAASGSRRRRRRGAVAGAAVAAGTGAATAVGAVAPTRCVVPPSTAVAVAANSVGASPASAAAVATRVAGRGLAEGVFGGSVYPRSPATGVLGRTIVAAASDILGTREMVPPPA